MPSQETDSEVETDGDDFRFRGGHPALDLTATLVGRKKPQRRELLASPGHLSRWLVAAGLVAKTPDTDEGARATALRLREATYELTLARVGGQSPPVAARRTLNEIARGGAARVELDARGKARLEGDAAELLAELARETIRLLGTEAGARIRQCEGEGCSILFLDISRAGARRWCSMKVCGNRSKVAEFRRRQSERDS